MWENCGQQISLDNLADVAKYSKYYFVRRFHVETRCSPVRFLSAVRMARSKYMLATTSTNVSDIAHAVGYLSYGTFTSRFTESVGLSPAQYRRHARGEEFPLRWSRSPAIKAPAPGTSLTGRLVEPCGAPVRLAYLSIFSAANPLSSAAALVIVANQGSFTLTGLTPGKWVARAITPPATSDSRPLRDYRAGSCEFQLDTRAHLDITIPLAERTIRTPPFLLALPDR
ncbi:helix-turn-helix transcriptional regulator [Nocardia panacis]|nr:helix-turn-helix transcriptional regulator [Nocardia panacis]